MSHVLARSTLWHTQFVLWVTEFCCLPPGVQFSAKEESMIVWPPISELSLNSSVGGNEKPNRTGEKRGTVNYFVLSSCTIWFCPGNLEEWVHTLSRWQQIVEEKNSAAELLWYHETARMPTGWPEILSTGTRLDRHRDREEGRLNL